MTRSFSIYLDLVRFAAATVVVLHHVWPVIFPSVPIPWPGHQAVVVFFVLSGYVVRYAVSQREQTAKDYAIHRAARVLSVAWPALAFGACLSAIMTVNGISFDFDFAKSAPNIADAAIQTLAGVGFLGQIWFLNLMQPVNAPYWSLNYEVWYYLLFGVLCFGQGIGRICLALAIAALAGPRIIALMPCWFVGVWLQRRGIRVAERWAVAGFVASILLYVPFFWFDLPIRLRALLALSWPGSPGFLGASNTFVGDYMLAGIVALNFASAGGVPQLGRVLTRIERPIRIMAAYTFSIYLYHAPVFVLLWSLLGLHSWLLLPTLAVGIIVLGYLTEARLPVVRLLLHRSFASPVGQKGRPRAT